MSDFVFLSAYRCIDHHTNIVIFVFFIFYLNVTCVLLKLQNTGISTLCKFFSIPSHKTHRPHNDTMDVILPLA